MFLPHPLSQKPGCVTDYPTLPPKNNKMCNQLCCRHSQILRLLVLLKPADFETQTSL